MDSIKDNGSQLPQKGWFLDVEWANVLAIEVRTFRDNCRKMQIPFKTFGATMIVRAEDFYSHAPGSGGEEG